MFKPSSIVFSYPFYLLLYCCIYLYLFVFICIYLLYLVIQYFCCQSVNKVQFSSGVPQNFKGEHLKFGLEFSMSTPKTLGLVGVTSLFHATCCEASVIIWMQLSECLPPKIWVDKKVQKFSAISDNFRL